MHIMHEIGKYVLPFTLKMKYDTKKRYQIPFQITVAAFTLFFYVRTRKI
jgi:hypothetical protein